MSGMGLENTETISSVFVPGARFSKGQVTFRARRQILKVKSVE